MRFRQLLILIVLLMMALLVSAQSGPNFSATRTALAMQTQIRQGTRVFETPAEFQLTVSAQALDATNAALTAMPATGMPTFEPQIVDTQILITDVPLELEPLAGDSVLPTVLLLFVGVLVTLGIIGVVMFFLFRREQNGGRPGGNRPYP